MLDNPEMVYKIYAMRQGGFVFQQENCEKEDFCDYFHYYLFLVVRLFILLAEYGNQEDKLVKILKKRIRPCDFLFVMLDKDLLEETNYSTFGTHLLKEELVQFFNNFYDTEIHEAEIH